MSKRYKKLKELQTSKKIESIENEMNKLRKAFRKYLGSQLNTKNTPELKFYIDDSHKYTKEIDKLIKEIKSDDK